MKAKTAARLRDTLGPQCEYLEAIRAELPDDGIYVEDLTQVGYVGRLAFPVYQPRTYIHSGYQGTLGFSYADRARRQGGLPRRPVVSISGDGGFMYNVQELSTAALHGIDVVAIVFADGAYGNVRRMQKNDYGNQLIATDLLNPNFPKMADSYGIAGVRGGRPRACAALAAPRPTRPRPDRGPGRRNARPLAPPRHAPRARLTTQGRRLNAAARRSGLRGVADPRNLITQPAPP